MDLSDLAERTVASVAARRSTWTVWNVRAEVERLLRAEVPFLPPERHRELADAVTALAVSPAHSLSAEAPALHRRACRAAARLVTLPADYVCDQVQPLYATTAHRAQGTTVDTAHPLITAGISREALYVLATRARERTVFYVATHDLPYDEDARVDQARHDPRQYAAREILLNALATEGAPLSATETITTAQEEAGSLSTLVPRYLHAARSRITRLRKRR